MSRILLGMSGGLDSTYSAWKRKQEGHTVEGILLKMSAATDTSVAEEAASAVGVPLHIVDCEELFQKEVISNFIEEYANGRTPNPCVVCNRFVKEAVLCDYAKAHGFDRVATGHYARVEQDPLTGRYAVHCADDWNKDQSYVLWQLTQEQLSLLDMPLCSYTKEEVREKAIELGLKAAERKESQEICFIPDNDYIGYIEQIKGKFPEGNFLTEDGTIVGRHKGIIRYTIGQRKGLGISFGTPLFVTKIDPLANTVTVALAGKERTSSLQANHLVWQSYPPQNGTFSLLAKIRYKAPLLPTVVTVQDEIAYANFPEGAKAVTPGQSVVFYEKNGIAFGGIIQ